MAPTFALLALALTLSSYVHAFSPDQCNVTTYGKPDKAACNTLLTTISKLGVGTNTSYLFTPSQYPTPANVSNNTRVNFPISWSTPGCNASLVPIEIEADQVTEDTSTYADLAAAGRTVVQQCISNATGAGGWELAGDSLELVLHLYAKGSQIEATIKQQTSSQIAATSEDEIDNAELDDPAFSDIEGGGSSATTGSVAGAGTSNPVSNPAAAAPAAAAVVPSSGTFKYLGCQADASKSGHTLSSRQWSGPGLYVDRCAQYCAGYQYMGLEAGSQCYCGGDSNGSGVKPATLDTSAANQCLSPCNGNATQLCGGDGWLTVYQNTKSATAGETS